MISGSGERLCSTFASFDGVRNVPLALTPAGVFPAGGKAGQGGGDVAVFSKMAGTARR